MIAVRKMSSWRYDNLGVQVEEEGVLGVLNVGLVGIKLLVFLARYHSEGEHIGTGLSSLLDSPPFAVVMTLDNYTADKGLAASTTYSIAHISPQLTDTNRLAPLVIRFQRHFTSGATSA